jgi:outer membrane protein OmpA-like peptidoglycan-associated protein
MNEHPELTLQIDGHTDNTGNAAYNLILSQKRADAVLEYLASKGVERNRMEAKGYGQEKPITGNDSPAQRAQNRRVELKLSYK